MYSPFWKYLCLGMGTFLAATAGRAATYPQSGSSVMVLAVLACVALYGYGRECRSQGAQPLTVLEPNREYRVEAVLPYHHNWCGSLTARLVVSWHVDYGHYEFRLAHLPHSDLTEDVRVGSIIRAARPALAYPPYRVESPTAPSGMAS